MIIRWLSAEYSSILLALVVNLEMTVKIRFNMKRAMLLFAVGVIVLCSFRLVDLDWSVGTGIGTRTGTSETVFKVAETTTDKAVQAPNPLKKANGTGSTRSTQNQQYYENYLQKCIEHRGSQGYWFVDPEFSRKTFYAYDFRSNKWLRENKNYQSGGDITKKDRYYPGNQYNWMDTSMLPPPPPPPPPSWEQGPHDGEDEREIGTNNQTSLFLEPLSCQIDRLANRKNFCKVIRELQIGRIMFVGDSLARAQKESLFRLIGVKKKARGDIPGVCSSSSSSSSTSSNDPADAAAPISFWYFRENIGSNLLRLRQQQSYQKDEMVQYGPETPYCNGETSRPKDDYCPWQLAYNSTTTTTTTTTTTSHLRTLLVLNQGAHFHSKETFANSTKLFVTKMNSIAHPGDIVVFRSTVPGHADCFNTQHKHQDEIRIPVVNMTHDKFLERYATTKYDWNLFDSYNQYAKQTLESDLNRSVVLFHYLNVYNMTVLRYDSHVAATDCLHYSHPGPIDFWNHLLVTNLLDIAKLLNKNKSSSK